ARERGIVRNSQHVAAQESHPYRDDVVSDHPLQLKGAMVLDDLDKALVGSPVKILPTAEIHASEIRLRSRISANGDGQHSQQYRKNQARSTHLINSFLSGRHVRQPGWRLAAATSGRAADCNRTSINNRSVSQRLRKSAYRLAGYARI